MAYLGRHPGTDAMEKVVDMYNQTNDKNVEINLQFVANKASGNTQTMDKLMASIAAGSPPEMALLDNFQVATYQQDALVKLDDLMAASGTSFDGIYDQPGLVPSTRAAPIRFPTMEILVRFSITRTYLRPRDWILRIRLPRSRS